ncbi:Cysteine synthase B [Arsenophonus endosymbiont of Bemisia tabaci Q2]|nr:Cysteine synthase B [Arsenophonus endosymbiont of Bemisia tabaci Q2]
MIATINGYKLKLLMPENMSVERQSLMRAYVAEIVFVTEAEGMGRGS